MVISFWRYLSVNFRIVVFIAKKGLAVVGGDIFFCDIFLLILMSVLLGTLMAMDGDICFAIFIC